MSFWPKPFKIVLGGWVLCKMNLKNKGRNLGYVGGINAQLL
jgi:hypothetical protein